MQSIYDVIIKPIISEKSTALQEVANRYVFQVSPRANKQEIRDAVQRLFNVNVKEVRTMIIHGKVKRAGKLMAKKPNWKKAIVTLGANQKIDFFQTK